METVKKEQVQNDFAQRRLEVPPFVKVHDVTPPGAAEPEFVLSNEATGKIYKANRPTVQFLDALRRTGSVGQAFHDAQIQDSFKSGLIGPLLQAGFLIEPGTTAKAPKPKAPLESKLVSLRADLIDAGPVAAAFSWLGRALFSPVGYFCWALAAVTAIFQLLANAEKVSLSLRSIPDMGWKGFLVFAGLYVVLKMIHELGHALAYRIFCLRAGLEPGPIRMGIAVFAMTPFPFTDVTGAWRLRSKWQRAMIGAGGLYFETWAIAILTIFWSQTQTGPVQTIILQVAVVAGLLTILFNLNPAVKLDGYYVLTDLIRRPNLATRASQSARNLVVRWLGAAGTVNGFDLGYWVISYLYRWTIFIGIFWLSYQFDPRLSPVVAVISLMMLVVRPAWSTFRFAQQRKLSVWRAGFVVMCFGALAWLVTMPLPDRLLMPGRFETFETRFIEPTEASRLKKGQNGLVFESPDLEQQIFDTKARAEILTNTSRAISISAVELATLSQDIDRISDITTQLQARQNKLNIVVGTGSKWTPMDGENFVGSWVASGTAPIGAVSSPIEPLITVFLDQALLEQQIDLDTGATLQVRLRHDPDCEFAATLRDVRSDITAFQGLIKLRADPTALPDCAAGLRSGSALVARLATPPKSIVTRLRISVSRLLQDRLPINLS